MEKSDGDELFSAVCMNSDTSTLLTTKAMMKNRGLSPLEVWDWSSAYDADTQWIG